MLLQLFPCIAGDIPERRFTQTFSAHLLRRIFSVFVILLGVLMIANSTAALYKH